MKIGNDKHTYFNFVFRGIHWVPIEGGISCAVYAKLSRDKNLLIVEYFMQYFNEHKNCFNKYHEMEIVEI